MFILLPSIDCKLCLYRLFSRRLIKIKVQTSVFLNLWNTCLTMNGNWS